MAKGTYRKKRLAVLDELEDHDAEWAAQIRDLQGSNPQAYRKELLKADVMLSAKTGRKTTLSMRPKRFGGEEDPVLVRRVLALRKAYPELTRGVDGGPVLGRPTPDLEDADRGHVEGWRQQRTPHLEDSDVGSADGWHQHRTPGFDDPDLGSVEGWKQDRSPGFDDPDLGSVDGWRQQRTPGFEAPEKDPGAAKGAALRGRAPEMVARPADDEDVGPVQTRRAAADGLMQRTSDGQVRRQAAAAPAGQAKAPASKKTASAARKGSSARPAGADRSILKGSVSDVKKALATGEHDAFLDELEAAETAGKGRKGVLKALEGRR